MTSSDAKTIKVINAGEDSVSDLVRSHAAIDLIGKEPGYTTSRLDLRLGAQIEVEACDVFLASRPIMPELLRAYRSLGAAILVDQDDDFASIPKSHVAYKNIGPGNPKQLAAHQQAIHMADHLIVSTPELARRLENPSHKTQVIPNGWDDANPLWTKPKPERSHVVIGFGGTITHREDFKLIKDVLVRICKDFPTVGILIVGDPIIYRTLREIPEYQKKLWPFMGYPKYPNFYHAIDILAVPLVNDRFNQGKSDIKLVEAGATCTPWVASPLPQYVNWGSGGIFAETPEQWYRSLTGLIQNPEKRMSLARTGHTHAQFRTFSALAPQWKQAIAEAMRIRDENSIRAERQRDGVELLGVESDGTGARYQRGRRRRG